MGIRSQFWTPRLQAEPSDHTTHVLRFSASVVSLVRGVLTPFAIHVITLKKKILLSLMRLHGVAMFGYSEESFVILTIKWVRW